MRLELHITRSDPLRQWIEDQVATRGYRSAGDYVRDILRKEQLREARQQIENHLLAALDQGPPTQMTTQDWEDIRAEGRRQAVESQQ